ncbi:GNAT family N-acetyltransferase [Sphingomonas sp. GC_Shp_6]|uniref:GNAT family N-acetyltransferase n=1 Tax=Sphingomonas sp. GC_Shp_6 TaxID=2937378 RepID=UPI002269FFD4
MNAPLSLAAFVRLPPVLRAEFVDGLAAGIDAVAETAAPTHRFLRYQWFAGAIAAYGGHPRTLSVAEDGVPVLALPFVGLGPGVLRLSAVPGSYWPFRSFPVADGVTPPAFEAALAVLARAVNGLRIGPVYDGDPAADGLIAAARARGWVALDRFVAESWLLEMGEDFPRGSTLRKNRFHEKHLAAHGALDWRFLAGADWPAAFADLASIERRSWIAARTDGRDAKFTDDGHGAFWAAAAGDPVLAAMFRAALLTVDGAPAAFSFDLDAGALRYAIANSYDPAFAKHSPGKLLYYRNLVAAKADGTERIDWGAGDSGYKQVIGAERGPAIRDWLLLRPGLPALLGPLIGRWWRRSGQGG